MRQSIHTKFHPGNGVSGSRAEFNRISATASGGIRVYVTVDPSVDDDHENHILAMKALCEQLSWSPLHFAAGPPPKPLQGVVWVDCRDAWR